MKAEHVELYRSYQEDNARRDAWQARRDVLKTAAGIAEARHGFDAWVPYAEGIEGFEDRIEMHRKAAFGKMTDLYDAVGRRGVEQLQGFPVSRIPAEQM